MRDDAAAGHPRDGALLAQILVLGVGIRRQPGIGEEVGACKVVAMVNNAGIVKMGPLRGSSLSDWQQVIDVNLTGAYLGMRTAIEPMIAAGGGSIINISSVEGLAGSAHLHSYVAAKFGLRGITKSAAVELAPHNIRVNSIHPGLVHTPLSHGVTEAFMAPIPMRRGASPEEVSHFVVFLASDESAYATGAEFVVDGGLTSYVPVKM
jgi:3alpha(or 20beta)-hydroxysteroid dehydrogenase